MLSLSCPISQGVKYFINKQSFAELFFAKKHIIALGFDYFDYVAKGTKVASPWSVLKNGFN